MANLAYIQVTRECNQECRFCSNPPTQRVASDATIRRFIALYKKNGYHGVIFTGGEPTVHPGLTRFIRYAKKQNLHCRIITNGQKLADPVYLQSLQGAGLEHLCLSVYSDDASLQAFLTANKDALKNIRKSLDNLKETGITVDIVTVINKYNAGHLARTVAWLVTEYPFISHFVWNNLDPKMNRAAHNTDTIPSLNDFELELHKAMKFLTRHNKTFRVERVPLCYMTEFAHCSTETRKIIKNEERMVYFLDEKEVVHQRGWYYQKAPCCSECALTSICAGLYDMDGAYRSQELYPVFVSKEEIIRKVNADER